ncbi:hypothetical protein GOV12_05915 [Candidatus Pacearchaeota archaeon]|nr:hypothetical protein [Candidatus Pacearchaeota archaeon]
MVDYDVMGNIAIIRNEKKTLKQKKADAKIILSRPSVETVLDRVTNVKGRLRTIKVRHIAGVKNLISLYRENACSFKFNIETCYFSPRLSNERQKISEKIKMKDKVLVMFAGIGVYPIVLYKYSKPEHIVGIEIGRECIKYFKENLKLNRIPEGKISVVSGDVKKKVDRSLGKFDVVIMARPNLRETFLKYGLIACKKGGRLFYYGFCKDTEVDLMVNDLVKEGKELGYRLKVIEKKFAGEIAPYKHRFRIEFKVRG